MSTTMPRQISPALAAFHDVYAAAYHVSDAPEATVAAYAGALKSIEKPPRGLDDTEVEQLVDTEDRLFTKLTRTNPTTNLELLMKTEWAIAGLLRSIEYGGRKEDIDLGRSALRDVRAAIHTDQASGDAELIEVCNRLVAIRQAEIALHATSKTIEDERRTETALDALSAETEALMRRIDDIPDTKTLAGLQALSRAARARAALRVDGTPYFDGGDAEWLAFEVTRALAEGTVA
jgi:hypothetical protein